MPVESEAENEALVAPVVQPAEARAPWTAPMAGGWSSRSSITASRSVEAARTEPVEQPDPEEQITIRRRREVESPPTEKGIAGGPAQLQPRGSPHQR